MEFMLAWIAVSLIVALLTGKVLAWSSRSADARRLPARGVAGPCYRAESSRAAEVETDLCQGLREQTFEADGPVAPSGIGRASK